MKLIDLPDRVDVLVGVVKRSAITTPSATPTISEPSNRP